MRVLLVIPCLNESGRIEPFLKSLREAFAQDNQVRVLVVDDGSEIAEQKSIVGLIERYRHGWPGLAPVHCLSQNIGKGGAVYEGWSKAIDEDILAFVDADGSCDCVAVKRLIDTAREQKAQCALLGSRVKMLGSNIDRSWSRHIIGRVFAAIVGVSLGIPVYDSQCGLKVIPRVMYEDVRAGLMLQRFAFDVELIAALWTRGFPMKEIPIDWHEVAGGKVKIFRDSFQMFRDVWHIKMRLLCGS
jgi:dolichyl-phosphate beta-glucosyltransferase